MDEGGVRAIVQVLDAERHVDGNLCATVPGEGVLLG